MNGINSVLVLGIVCVPRNSMNNHMSMSFYPVAELNARLKLTEFHSRQLQNNK